jgi:hypothetical protein
MASLLGWGSMRGFKKHDLANKVRHPTNPLNTPRSTPHTAHPPV